MLGGEKKYTAEEMRAILAAFLKHCPSRYDMYAIMYMLCMQIRSDTVVTEGETEVMTIHALLTL